MDSPTARLRALLDGIKLAEGPLDCLPDWWSAFAAGHNARVEELRRAVLADLDAGKAREAVLAGAMRGVLSAAPFPVPGGLFDEALSTTRAALSNVGGAAEALLARLAAAERERGRLARELEECTNERDAARVVSEGRVRAERERDAALAERDRLRVRVEELEAERVRP